jgi:hypothetical protein
MPGRECADRNYNRLFAKGGPIRRIARYSVNPARSVCVPARGTSADRRARKHYADSVADGANRRGAKRP